MKSYTNFPLDGYSVAEKYDGIHAIWVDDVLLSRDYKEIHAPTWWLNELPTVGMLRGELWCGRGTFEQTMSICRSHTKSIEWKKVSFMGFCIASSTLPKTKYFTPVPWESCTKDADHYLSSVISSGGEGVVFRNNLGSMYKYKPISDADATVVEHIPGKGKHKGRLGAIIVDLIPSSLLISSSVSSDPIRFKIGTGFSDEQRQSPPPIGSVISFTYSGFSRNGVPKCAAFKRQRFEGE